MQITTLVRVAISCDLSTCDSIAVGVVYSVRLAGLGNGDPDLIPGLGSGGCGSLTHPASLVRTGAPCQSPLLTAPSPCRLSHPWVPWDLASLASLPGCSHRGQRSRASRGASFTLARAHSRLALCFHRRP